MSTDLKVRKEGLLKAIEQSAANHHMLLGMLQEVTRMIEIVEPSTVPIIEGVESAAKIIGSAIDAT